MWSPDGRLLAFAPHGRDTTGLEEGVGVRVWAAATGTLLACFPFPEKYSGSIAWSPDGAFLASSHFGGGKDTSRLWDTRPLLPAQTASVPTAPLTRLDITRLAAYLTAASLLRAGQGVVLVTTGGGGTVQPLTRQADLVALWTARTLEPAEPRLSLASARAMVRTLHVDSPEPVLVLPTHAWFAAEEELEPPPGLRALRVSTRGRTSPRRWPGAARAGRAWPPAASTGWSG